MTATKVQRKNQFPTQSPKKSLPGDPSGVPKRSKKNPSLDSNVNFAAKPVNTGISKGSYDLYKLRDNAAKVLPFLGVCKCGKVPYKKYVTIDKNEKNVKRYGNINHCGSVWICPTCAYKKMKVRQDQIKDIIKMHNDSGCTFYFVTLTIRHNSNQPLTVLLKNVTSAWRQITEERAIKPLFKTANYIQSLECRFSNKSGWSPHFHAVFMSTEKEKVKPLFDLLIDSWTKKTGSEKAGQKIIEATNEESLSEYIAKISLANELTEGQTKTSRKGDSVSYFDMLKDTIKFKKQIEEYGYATKGVQTLRKSKGLNITKDKDQDKDQVKENILNIHEVPYKETIVKKCDYKKVLEMADKWPDIAEYFKDYDINKSEKMISPKGDINKNSPKIRTGKKPQFYRKLFDKMAGKITIGRPAKRKKTVNF